MTKSSPLGICYADVTYKHGKISLQCKRILDSEGVLSCLLIFVMAWPPSFFTLKKKKKKKVRIGSDVLLFPKLKIRLRNKYRPQMISISTRTSRKI